MKKILMVSSIAVTLAMISMTSAQAGSCKSGKVYETGGASVSWAGASIKAKAEWRINVIAKYGVKYAAWLLARKRGVTCWKVGGIHKQCKASGIPCRP